MDVTGERGLSPDVLPVLRDLYERYTDSMKALGFVKNRREISWQEPTSLCQLHLVQTALYGLFREPVRVSETEL